MVISRQKRRELERWIKQLPAEKALYVNEIMRDRVAEVLAGVMEQYDLCISAALIYSQDLIENLEFTMEDLELINCKVLEYLGDSDKYYAKGKNMKEAPFNLDEFREKVFELLEADYNQKEAIEALKKIYPNVPKAAIPVYYKKFKEEWLKPKVELKDDIPEGHKPQIKEVDPSEFEEKEEKPNRVTRRIEKADAPAAPAKTPEIIPAAAPAKEEEEEIQFLYPIKAAFKGEEVEIHQDHIICAEGKFDNLAALLEYKEASIREFETRIGYIEKIINKIKG